MNDFLGTYANLAGRQLGNFRVEELAGRNRQGAPRWKVVCRCGCPQTIEHAKLAPLVQGRRSQLSLLCASPACELSRQTSEIETVEQFRRREQMEAKHAATAAAEAERISVAKAEELRAQAIREFEIQRQYTRYVNHQWNAGQSDDAICTRQRWFELTDGSRQIVMDAITKNPAVRIGAI